jgi:hypothetical protein
LGLGSNAPLPAAWLSRNSKNEHGTTYGLCEARFGPFRQNSPGPFFVAVETQSMAQLSLGKGGEAAGRIAPAAVSRVASSGTGQSS